MAKILSIFVAFIENMNFTIQFIIITHNDPFSVPEAVPMGTGKMISILAMKPTERKLTLKR